MGKRQIIATDDIALPWVEAQKSQEQRLMFNGHTADKLVNFRIKMNTYKTKHQGVAIQAYFFVIPKLDFDQVTGEPTPELVEFFRQHFEKARE